MRQAGELSTQRDADRFVQFLSSHGIEANVRAEAGGTFSIWVIEEKDIGRAREYLAAFAANPSAPEFTRSGAGRIAAPESRSRLVNVRREVFIHSQSEEPLTLALIAISVAVTCASELLSM